MSHLYSPRGVRIAISAKLVIYSDVGIIPWLFFHYMGRNGNGKKLKWLFFEGWLNSAFPIMLSSLTGLERIHLFATRTQGQ